MLTSETFSHLIFASPDRVPLGPPTPNKPPKVSMSSRLPAATENAPVTLHASIFISMEQV